MTCTSCNRESFHNEARWQYVCAGCDSASRPWHAHHAVHEQHVKRLGGHKWDPRNALRLCTPRPDGCHWLHHGRKKLETKKLTDSNIEFGAELMGPGAAVGYFRRYYDDSDPDPRLEALVKQPIDLGPLRRELDKAVDGEVVLFGSVVLYLHGLRDTIGDVEFFTTLPRWYSLLSRGWAVEEPVVGDPQFLTADLGVGVPVHAFHAWCPSDWGVCRDACFREAEMVQGWPCAPLWLIASHKRCSLHIVGGRGVELVGSRWEKHLHDLRRIEAALHGREIHEAIASAA